MSRKKKEKIDPDESWEKLRAGFYKVVDFLDSDRRVPFNNEGYSNVYSLTFELCTGGARNVLGGLSPWLYEKLKGVMGEYLTNRVVPLLSEIGQEDLLRKNIHCWRNHLVVSRYLCKLFNYLDRFYTKNRNDVDGLRLMGMKMYHQHVHQITGKNLVVALLQQVMREREGELIDRSLLHDGVYLLIEMGFGEDKTAHYQADFEEVLLKHTEEFYLGNSQKWAEELSASEYMKLCETRINEEIDRCKQLFHPMTEPKLMKIVDDQIIRKHHPKMIRAFRSMVTSREDLARLYLLLKRIKRLDLLKTVFGEFVVEEGLKIIKRHQDECSKKEKQVKFKSYVEAMLDLMDHFYGLAIEEFQNDSIFLECLKDCFQRLVNTELVNEEFGVKQSSSELLCRYCDYLLKNARLGEEALEQMMDRVVRLFTFVSDKDMFSEFYRRMLSKRLLKSRGYTMDKERSFVGKLKMKCGHSFTHYLEGMMKDLTLSKELQGDFKSFYFEKRASEKEKEKVEEEEKKKKSVAINIDFTPTVLTRSFWPYFRMDHMSIPPSLAPCIDTFMEFYTNRTVEKKIDWIHGIGSCELIARLKYGKKLITVTTYQAAILMMYNDHVDENPGFELKMKDLKKNLNLNLDVIKAHLYSLCKSRARRILIKKSGPKNKITENCGFGSNFSFKSDKMKLKVPEVMLMDRKVIRERVMEDRKHSIDASIVRIMKMRRRMDHSKLVMEAIKQLSQHFNVEPAMVKRRISTLITREYLERDDDNPKIYNYLA